MKHTDEIITKYLSGDITGEEQREVNAWLELAKNKKIFEEYEKTWKMAGSLKQTILPDEDTAWLEFSKKKEGLSVARAGRPVIYWIGAALAVISLLLFALLFKPKADEIVKQTVPSVPQNNLLSEVFTTDSMLQFFLPDSSRVWLNKGSKLFFPEKFSGNTRVVNLEGEAFFEVRKDTAKPFLIYAGKSVAKVTGTSFNLKAYKESDLELTVVTGTVEFAASETSENPKLVLVRNDKILVNNKTLETSKSRHRNENYSWWKDRKLRFKKFLGKMKRIFKKGN